MVMGIFPDSLRQLKFPIDSCIRCSTTGFFCNATVLASRKVNTEISLSHFIAVPNAKVSFVNFGTFVDLLAAISGRWTVRVPPRSNS